MLTRILHVKAFEVAKDTEKGGKYFWNHRYTSSEQFPRWVKYNGIAADVSESSTSLNRRLTF